MTRRPKDLIALVMAKFFLDRDRALRAAGLE
jgi:hypothetical protein